MWLVLGLLACGGGEVAWCDIEVVDETGLGDVLVDHIQEEIEWMAGASGLEGVSVETIAVVPTVPVPARLQSESDEGVEYVSGGRYVHRTRRIELGMDQWPAPTDSARHELCHAVDRATGITKEHADQLTAALLPERLVPYVAWPSGKEAEEVYAALCAEVPLEPLAALVGTECELELQDAAVAMVHGWAFPELAPPLAETVDFGLHWVELPLDVGQDTAGFAVHDGALWTVVEQEDLYEIQLLDPATGDLVERLTPPGALDQYPRMIVSREIQGVLYSSEGWLLEEGAWSSFPLPDVSFHSGHAHDGRVFLEPRWDTVLPVVDPDLGTWTLEAVPEGADPEDFDLFREGERLFLVSGWSTWERQGDQWLLTQPLQSHGSTRWALLQDDRAVLWWEAWPHLDGLALGHPDGSVSLAQDACESERDALATYLLTDGERVVVTDGERMSWVELP